MILVNRQQNSAHHFASVVIISTTSDLLCCQLLEVADWEVRQKREDGSQKVWWPRGYIAHRA